MILVCPNFYKNNLIPFLYFKAKHLQTLINSLCENYFAIFSWTNKIVQKYCNIMALMYVFTHKTKLILYSKQSFGELTPERLEMFTMFCTA